jgi:F-type H+-transporting ATPase subunit alpha
VPVSDVRRFEAEFLDFLGRGDNGVFDAIRSEDDTVSSLERAVEAFYGQFTTGEGESLQVNEAEAEAMDASERGQERVQVKKKA